MQAPLALSFAPYIYLSKHREGGARGWVNDEIWERDCFTLLHSVCGVVRLESPRGDVHLPPGGVAIGEPGCRIVLGRRSRANWLTFDIVHRAREWGEHWSKHALRVPHPSWRQVFGQDLVPLLPGDLTPAAAEMVDRLAIRYWIDDRQHLLANHELAGFLLRYSEHLQRGGRAATSSSLAEAVERMIVEHLRDGLRVVDLAARLGVSAQHLRRRYRQERGRTLAAAIEARQQVVACDRLRDPRLPVAQVAVLADFHDPSAFTRWFRTRTGETPRAWRQRCAREAQAGS